MLSKILGLIKDEDARPRVFLGAGIAIAILLLWVIVPAEYSMPVITVLLGAIALGLFVSFSARAKERKSLFTILIFGFLLRALLALIVHYSQLGESLFLQPDAVTYDKLGWGIAKAWREGRNFDIVGATEHIQVGYYYFLAVVYFLVGHSPIIVKLLNCFIGALTGLYIYHIAKRIFDKNAAILAILLTTFFPSLVFWSTQNLKDSLVILLICLIVWSIINLQRGFRWNYLLIALFSSLYLSSLRTYMLFLLGFSIALSFLLSGRGGLKRKAVLAGCAVLLMGGIFFFYRQFGALKWNYLLSLSFETLDRIRRTTTVGGSAFHPEADVSTLPKALAFLPIGLTYVLFAPFPWMGGSLLARITFPEMLVWYALVPFTFYGVFYSLRKKRRESLAIIFFLVTTMATLAVMQGNVGTLYRQRAPLLVFYLVFASVGIVELRREIESREEYKLSLKIQLVLKRLLDLAFSIVALILLSPLFVLVGAMIVIDNGFPIFYVQERVGYKGKVFKMIKFRSMVNDADKVGLGEPIWEEDPRITRTGRWLRRWTLDELPQLINVVKGEMSLVGPRPTFPFRMEGADEHQRKRLLMKPGLTGWQQVNGRNSLTWDEIIELDNWYVEHFSIWLDLYILWLTPGMLLRGEGLYPPRERCPELVEGMAEAHDDRE